MLENFLKEDTLQFIITNIPFFVQHPQIAMCTAMISVWLHGVVIFAAKAKGFDY